MFEFESGIVHCFTFILCFVWRITFACLVVYKWQVRHGVSDEDHGKSRRLGVEDWGWSHRSGTRWPDDREVG
jgi:hypothetical protein